MAAAGRKQVGSSQFSDAKVRRGFEALEAILESRGLLTHKDGRSLSRGAVGFRYGVFEERTNTETGYTGYAQIYGTNDLVAALEYMALQGNCIE